MLLSSEVQPNQPINSDHINRLVRDMWQIHNHSAYTPWKISHANLLDGAIANTYTSHAAINRHIQGSGTSSDPDGAGGGGARRVHGLYTKYGTGDWNRYPAVTGCYPSQWEMRYGRVTVSVVYDPAQKEARGVFSFSDDLPLFEGEPVMVLLISEREQAGIVTAYQMTQGRIYFKYFSPYLTQPPTNVTLHYMVLGRRKL